MARKKNVLGASVQSVSADGNSFCGQNGIPASYMIAWRDILVSFQPLNLLPTKVILFPENLLTLWLVRCLHKKLKKGERRGVIDVI